MVTASAGNVKGIVNPHIGVTLVTDPSSLEYSDRYDATADLLQGRVLGTDMPLDAWLDADGIKGSALAGQIRDVLRDGRWPMRMSYLRGKKTHAMQTPLGPNFTSVRKKLSALVEEWKPEMDAWTREHKASFADVRKEWGWLEKLQTLLERTLIPSEPGMGDRLAYARYNQWQRFLNGLCRSAMDAPDAYRSELTDLAHRLEAALAGLVNPEFARCIHRAPFENGENPALLHLGKARPVMLADVPIDFGIDPAQISPHMDGAIHALDAFGYEVGHRLYHTDTRGHRSYLIPPEVEYWLLGWLNGAVMVMDSRQIRTRLSHYDLLHERRHRKETIKELGGRMRRMALGYGTAAMNRVPNKDDEQVTKFNTGSTPAAIVAMGGELFARVLGEDTLEFNMAPLAHETGLSVTILAPHLELELTTPGTHSTNYLAVTEFVPSDLPPLDPTSL